MRYYTLFTSKRKRFYLLFFIVSPNITICCHILQELIDRIDVYEVTGTGKNRKQMIKIHYKFIGYLELPSLARRHNYREETRKGVAVEYVPNALPA